MLECAVLRFFGKTSRPETKANDRPAPNVSSGQAPCLVREFRYEYAALSPWDGHLDYMTSGKMNTENMSKFLAQVSKSNPSDFCIMVLDGASSHKSKDCGVLAFTPPLSFSYRMP